MGNSQHHWPCVMGIHQSLAVSLINGPVMQHFDIFLVAMLNKVLNKQLICQWLEMMLMWHHYNGFVTQKKIQEIFALIACPVNSSSHKRPKMWNCLSWKFIVMNRISEALVSGWKGSSEIKFISNLKIANGHDLFRQPIIILSSNMEKWTTRDQESTTIHKNKIVGLVQCRPNSTT